jgi:hypothetical protein
MNYKTKALYISGTPIKITKHTSSNRGQFLISFLERHSPASTPPEKT